MTDATSQPGGSACGLPHPLALTAEQQQRYQSTELVARILDSVRVIAVVGMSRRTERPAHYVPAYLQRAGYRVIPVTPQQEAILGEAPVPDLLHLPEPVDLALVFRPGPFCLAVAEQAVAAGIPRIWFQLHIEALDAANYASQHGLEVVLDRCMMVEHRRHMASA